MYLVLSDKKSKCRWSLSKGSANRLKEQVVAHTMQNRGVAWPEVKATASLESQTVSLKETRPFEPRKAKDYFVYGASPTTTVGYNHYFGLLKFDFGINSKKVIFGFYVDEALVRVFVSFDFDINSKRVVLAFDFS